MFRQNSGNAQIADASDVKTAITFDRIFIRSKIKIMEQFLTTYRLIKRFIHSPNIYVSKSALTSVPRITASTLAAVQTYARAAAKQRNVAAAYWLPTDGTDRHRQTDRRTDGRTTERYIDAYDAAGVNKAHAECRACLNVHETVYTHTPVRLCLLSQS